MKRALWHTASVICGTVYIHTTGSTFMLGLLALMLLISIWGDYAQRRLIEAQREQIELLKADVLELGGDRWWRS